MSLLTDLTNALTGGQNNPANSDLQAALANIQATPTPTAADLQLSTPAQYQVASTLNPALTTAAEAGPSAYNAENLSQVPISVMQQALGQEQAIASAQGMTPQEKASIAQAEEAANQATAGQRGAIAQNFEGMGVPQSLVSAALQNGTAGQEAEQNYQNALQAQGQAATQGINALQNAGALGSTMYSAESGQANTVAAAQNALNEFNASNTQQTALANQSNTQASNAYNAQNTQNASNLNTQEAQTVQEQNQVNAKLQAAQDALAKTAAETGVSEGMASQATAQGNQTLGVAGGIGGTAADLIGSAIPTGGKAQGGEIEPKVPATAFLRGGQVPGQAVVPGNSPKNDLIATKLSPGEFVVPRTAMSNPAIRNYLAQNVPTPRPPAPHPSDIASLMRAMAELRGQK